MRRSDSYRAELQRELEEKEQAVRAESSQSILQLSRAHNRSQDFYQNLRRKKIEDILNSEENAKEKFHQLKIETDKLGEKIKLKEELARVGNDEEAQLEAAELLLSSIKAKMGIMTILKDEKGKPGSARTEE